jgi:Outer membrane protein beta-barrel domain
MKNIKSTTIRIFAIALMISAANCQIFAHDRMGKIEIGARLFPTFSAFNLKTYNGGTVSGQGTFGLGYGGLLAFHFNKHVAVQAEVIYNSISQKYKENSLDRNIKLKYVNIPLLVSVNSDKTKKLNFNAVAGPQMGVSVGSSLTTTGTDTSVTSNAVLAIKKGDFGFAYGAGVGYGLNDANTIRVSAGFRGVFGLLDISDNSNNSNTNSYFILDKTSIKTYAGYIGISILL